MGELSLSMGELSLSMGELSLSMGELSLSMGELSLFMGELSLSMGELSLSGKYSKNAQNYTGPYRFLPYKGIDTDRDADHVSKSN